MQPRSRRVVLGRLSLVLMAVQGAAWSMGTIPTPSPVHFGEEIGAVEAMTRLRALSEVEVRRPRVLLSFLLSSSS